MLKLTFLGGWIGELNDHLGERFLDRYEKGQCGRRSPLF